MWPRTPARWAREAIAGGMGWPERHTAAPQWRGRGSALERRRRWRRGGAAGIDPGTPQEAGAGKTAGPLRQKRHGPGKRQGAYGARGRGGLGGEEKGRGGGPGTSERRARAERAGRCVRSGAARAGANKKSDGGGGGGEGEGAGRGGEGGIEPGNPRAAVAGETAGPFRQKRRGSENTRAPPGRAGGVAGQAESVAQLRIHSRPDSTACASSRWLPWASGCAACAVDQPWLRHIHSRVSATINFFAEPDVGARPGTEQFCGCAHPCCDQ